MKSEFFIFIENFKKLDKRIAVIFIVTAVLQTISWYYTSRIYFRKNIFPAMRNDPNVFLYEYLFWFIGDFLVFFILPIILILFFHKDKPRNFGLQLGNWKLGLKFSALFLAIMIPVLWFISGIPEFSNNYPHLQSAKENFQHLLFFEAAMLLYMFGWEFIWRGYLQFGLEKKFGIYSIFIQMIPFVILHNGKPELETFSAILGGLALGCLAYRTRSFIYGVIVHFIIMFSIDIFSVIRYKMSFPNSSGLIHYICKIFIT